jgi:hypothetical protein
MDFSSIAGLLDKNADWLLPVANATLGAFGANQQSSNRDAMLNASERAILAQYDREQAQGASDAEYETAYNNWAAGQRARSAAAAAANQRAAQAAAAATRKNQFAARKKGDKVQTDAMRNRMTYFAPFKDTALRLLPQMEGAYSQGNGALRQIGANLLTPQGIEDTFKPQYQTSQKIALPSFLQGGR